MPPILAPVCSDELYSHLVEIVSPRWPSPPVVQEIAILPSASHAGIQYDPSSDPPAVGIPKALLLACFLRARALFFSHLDECREENYSRLSPFAPSDRKWAQAYEASAVILLWEPNHLTAINWRKKALAQRLQASSPQANSILEGYWLAESVFLVSMLTSPLSQHAKSSILWAHRLQILQAFKERHKSLDEPGPTSSWRTPTQVWREELKVVMIAGERHSRNYHAWEHARQVWWLLFHEKVRSKVQSENTSIEVGFPDVLLNTINHVQKWCLMHPSDISGWAFLAFLVLLAPNEGAVLKETMRVTSEAKTFILKYDWTGESVGWFLKMMQQLESLD